MEVICNNNTYGYGDGVLSRWTGIGRVAWTIGNPTGNDWQEGYHFFIAAQDNGEPGYMDTWRIRIMDKDSNAVLFDSNSNFGYIFDKDPFCNTTWDDCNGDPLFEGDSLGGEGIEKGGGNVQVHCKGGPPDDNGSL